MAKAQCVSVNSLSPDQRKRVKTAVDHIVDSLTRKKAEDDLVKSIIGEINEQVGVSSRVLRRLAKTQFANSHDEQAEEHETFEDFYQILHGIK